jgi:peptidoglycan/xylan/chitin deacetylase (PgdA/CDA1 family)
MMHMTSAPFPILLYHRIDDAGLSTSTPPEAFYNHLSLLRDEGWRTLSAEEFSRCLDQGRAPPPRTFLITFDDGYETLHSEALGMLRALDFTAIAFIATALIRDDDSLTGDEDKDKFMTWEQVRELQDSGVFDCQSHSHTHDNFTSVPVDQIRSNLETSIELLSSRLRLPRNHVRHLAWPWGLSTPAWREAALQAGLRYQYGVSRQSFRAGMPTDDIPRTCFDASSVRDFQRQFWLQTGSMAPLWDIAYPVGKQLRKLTKQLRSAA